MGKENDCKRGCIYTVLAIGNLQSAPPHWILGISRMVSLCSAWGETVFFSLLSPASKELWNSRTLHSFTSLILSLYLLLLFYSDFSLHLYLLKMHYFFLQGPCIHSWLSSSSMMLNFIIVLHSLLPHILDFWMWEFS